MRQVKTPEQRGALRSWDRWAEAWSNKILKVEARRLLHRLRLEAVLDDEAIVMIELRLTPPRAEAGFVLFRNEWGRGLMTKCLKP